MGELQHSAGQRMAKLPSLSQLVTESPVYRTGPIVALQAKMKENHKRLHDWFVRRDQQIQLCKI